MDTNFKIDLFCYKMKNCSNLARTLISFKRISIRMQMRELKIMGNESFKLATVYDRHGLVINDPTRTNFEY